MLWNSERRSVIRIGRPCHWKNYSVSGREIGNKYQFCRRSILLHLCRVLNHTVFSVGRTPGIRRFIVAHSELASAE